MSLAEYRETESQMIARSIMGRRFFGIPEMTKPFGTLSPESEAMLATIPYDEATLRRYHHGHVLVADYGLSIREMHMSRNPITRRITVNGPIWQMPATFEKDPPCWRLININLGWDDWTKTQPRKFCEVTKEGDAWIVGKQLLSARQMLYLDIANHSQQRVCPMPRIYALRTGTPAQGSEAACRAIHLYHDGGFVVLCVHDLCK